MSQSRRPPDCVLCVRGGDPHGLHMCYCMCMLDHRVQILLDEQRYRKVASEAKRRRVSIAAVIRDALDRLPNRTELRQTAIEAILDAEPMPMPSDPADLRGELDAAHTRLQK